MNLLKTKEAAAYLEISEITLKRWRRDEIGPAYLKHDSGRIFYQKTDLDIFIRNHSFHHCGQ